MKSKATWCLFLGLAIICALFVWQGAGNVAAILADGGWALLLVCLFAPTDQLMGAEAYRRLFRASVRPPVFATWMASWMGSAVNTLLPVATIGGEVVKARMLVLGGTNGEPAVAAMIVDKTVQAIVVLLWALAGIAMLAWLTDDRAVISGALFGAAGLAIGISGFVWVQVKGGTSFLARTADTAGRNIGGGKWRGVVDKAEAVDEEIRVTYRRPAALTLASALRLSARIILIGEVMLAAHLMGYPITIMEALMLKGLATGIRGVAFAIPGGLGVQEGGYIAVGALIGLPPELMLAVSLTTRVREIVPNIPFLLYWQFAEGRHQWRKARSENL